MRTAQLTEVCEIVMGQAPKGDTYNQDGVGLPLIAGAGDFGELHPEVTKYTTADKVRTCEAGDIVLSIRASIGTKVLADREYCLGRGVAGLRAGQDVSDRYLWHWTTAAAPALTAKGRGATFLQVNKTDIAELEIPLPPIEEQRRIAAVLDAADELRAKRRESLAKLDTLTQAIFIDMFGDPLANPLDWPTRPFAELCPTILGKMLDAKQQTGLHPRPYLRNANVRWFEFDLTDLDEMDFDERARDKYRLTPGDVLICEGGEPGRAAVWRGEIAECYFQKALHRGRSEPSLATSDFIVHLLRRLAERGGLVDHISTATIAHLTGRRLKEMLVIAPPVELQRDFARRLDHVTQASQRVSSSQAKVDELFASLQQRAFRGDL